MKILEIIFGKNKTVKKVRTMVSSGKIVPDGRDIDVRTRVDAVMRGVDEKSQAIHDRANKTQASYATAHRQAKKVLKESEKLVKILDTLSAVAIETGGRERGFKG